jgi:hypothetical protein
MPPLRGKFLGSQSENNEKSSVLDTLLVVAENIKLLLFGPLVAGLVAWGGAHLLPQTYVSEAILLLPTTVPSGPNAPAATIVANQAASIMVSPLVLDPVIAGEEDLRGQPVETARVLLASRIKAVVGKDGLLRVTTSASAPESARKLATDVIATWLKTTIPTKQEREELEARLAYVERGIASTSDVVNNLKATDLLRPTLRGDAGTNLLAIGELQSRYLEEALTIKRQMRGFTVDVIKQPPTLPRKAELPKKGLIAVLVALLAGLFILIFIFLRNALVSAKDNSEFNAKILRIISTLRSR